MTASPRPGRAHKHGVSTVAAEYPRKPITLVVAFAAAAQPIPWPGSSG
jgi:hypothetical protein